MSRPRTVRRAPGWEGHTELRQRADTAPRGQALAVLERLVREARTVAVVGLSPDPGRPSHGVSRYLRRAGLRIVPVNPNLTSWEGLEAYASLADVPTPVDIVDVFRRPEHVPEIARAAVTAGAGARWVGTGGVREAGGAGGGGGGGGGGGRWRRVEGRLPGVGAW